MAGGLLPIGATKISAAGGLSSPMLIGDLEISQTAVCQSGTCISGSFCSCSGSFTNIPVGRSVYALSADVQCNGGMGIFNITSPQISSIQSSLQQPPQEFHQIHTTK